MTDKNTKNSSTTSNSKDSGVSEESTERYITDMKELPDYKTEEKKEPTKPQTIQEATVDKPKTMPSLKSVKSDEKPSEPMPSNSLPKKNLTMQTAKSEDVVNADKTKPMPTVSNEESEGNKKRFDNMPFSMKDIILGVINVVTIVLLVILLFRIPKKANEVKSLRNDNVKSQTKIELESAALDKSKKMADQLNGLFLDESGVVNFVSSVDKMKAAGVVTDITFASQKATVDKTDNSGIPVSIKMAGTWAQIEPTLMQIQQLPFLERPIEVTATENGQGVLIFNYGILLYVNESLGQAR